MLEKRCIDYLGGKGMDKKIYEQKYTNVLFVFLLEQLLPKTFFKYQNNFHHSYNMIMIISHK